MDDGIKLFAKNAKDWGSNSNNNNIQSEYRDEIWQRKMCHTNNQKRKETNNWRDIIDKSRKNRNVRTKETHKYIGSLKADTIKPAEMNEKNFLKEYLRRTRKRFEPMFCCRNLHKGINTWMVPLVIYVGPFLKWTKEKLQQMDQKTRKLMKIQKSFWDDIDWQYLSIEEIGRPTLKIAWIEQYEILKSTLKK